MLSGLSLNKELASLVEYLLACACPPLPSFTVLLLREDCDLHAVVEEGVVLEQVDDVEPQFHGVLHAHAKIEPLQVPLGVDVILQHQIVLIVGHLICCQQVPTLEVGIERYEASLLIRPSHFQP